MTDLHRPPGSLADGTDPVLLTPEMAGWNHSGLRVIRTCGGIGRTLSTGPFEIAILPLSGSATVTCEGRDFDLEGRESVFARVTDFLYVPSGSDFTIESPSDGEFALCMARTSRRLAAKYGPADGVGVEVRGAGPATRQVTNFLSPDVWGHADKLMCVELLTPDGNWSSYPPHKHDSSAECLVNNEEIYYFRIARAGSTEPSSDGFGMHRTYTSDGEIDQNVAVRDGSVFLIPRGYHGPCIAAPGYTMYYLNVLAGGGPERSMAFCDDPAHHWVRDTWADMEPDPRCPMTDQRGLLETRS